MANLQNKLAWQKTAVEISGIERTTEAIVTVAVKSTGKRASIRRDMAEFHAGRVFVPLWLARRIEPNIHF